MRRAGLSMREVMAYGGKETRDALAQDWPRWLGPDWFAAPIPNEIARPDAYLAELQPEVLILTGGNDLVPAPGRESNTAPRRNRTERILLDTAISLGTPVLGVCRGLHLINEHFGGSTTSDLTSVGVPPNAHVASQHDTRLLCRFGRWDGGAVIFTNSYHNQGIFSDQLATELTRFAVSVSDDIVEALYHPRLPIVAVQWHPERSSPARAFDRLLFDALVTGSLPWLASR